MRKRERPLSLPPNKPRLRHLSKAASPELHPPNLPPALHPLRAVLNLTVPAVTDLRLKRKRNRSRSYPIARMRKKKSGISSTLTKSSLRSPLPTLASAVF